MVVCNDHRGAQLDHVVQPLRQAVHGHQGVPVSGGCHAGVETVLHVFALVVGPYVQLLMADAGKDLGQFIEEDGALHLIHCIRAQLHHGEVGDVRHRILQEYDQARNGNPPLVHPNWENRQAKEQCSGGWRGLEERQVMGG